MIDIQHDSVQKEYYYACETSDTVIVFIHGIIEGPSQFTDLVQVAKDHGYAVLNLLLPGHGTTGKDFAHSSMEKWINHVDCAVDQMRAIYKHIILVGHSMGCLLAVHTCMKNANQIDGIFAIAIPLVIRLHSSGIRLGLKVIRHKLDETNEKELAAMEVYSVCESSLVDYISWIPRYLELFRLCHVIKKELPRLRTPICFIHSKDDEFIGRSTVKMVKKLMLNEDTRIVILENSGHFYYSNADRDMLRSCLVEFADELVPQDLN